MGNIIKFTSEEASYDKQELNLLNLLNEDTLGHITSYISVRDLLNFSATCKYYQYVYLAPNRPQWAQMCQNLGGSSTVITAILSNSGVLKDDLEKIYEDKEKMKSVDFKRVIKEYYIFVLNKTKLRELLNPKLKDIVIYRGWMRNVLEIIPTIDVHPFNNWTLLNQYWTSLDLATAHYAKDYYYVVDLDVDPVSIEQISGTLPQYCANRLVLYKKSTDTAITKKEFLARTMTVT